MNNQDLNYQHPDVVAFATSEQKAAFYKHTYGHVAGGVLVFILLEALFLQSEFLVNTLLSFTQGYLWLVLIGGFMGFSWLAQKMVADGTSKPKQYLGYFIYIVGQALLFVPMLYIVMSYTGTIVLKQAVAVTAALFIALTVVAFMSKVNFSFLRSIIAIGFLLAMGAIVAGMIFGFSLGLWFSVAMCALAAGSILYETQQLQYQYATNQYVAAALGLFSSLMLLFWYVLRIFMSRD